MIKEIMKIYDRFLLTGILVLSLLLRLFRLESRAIWYDEALDVIQAAKSIPEIFHDVPTPLHYLFVHFFLNFGKNTVSLGLPSVVFGVLSVYMIFKIGNKFINKTVGLISAFLLAISPMHIEFSQQILHYSYFIFFSLWSIYMYLEFVTALRTHKVRLSHVLLLIIANVGNVMTHISAFLILASQILSTISIVLLDRNILQKMLKNIVFIVIITILSLALFIKLGSGFYEGFLNTGLTIGMDKPIQLGYSLSRQLNVPTLTFNQHFLSAMFSWFGIGSEGLRLPLYGGFFVLGVIALLLKKKYWMLAYFMTLMVYPFVQLYFIRPTHWFEEKYFIFIIPVYLMIISVGIDGISQLMSLIIRRPLIRAFAIVGICAFIANMAYKPIMTRTTYGYKVGEEQEYSWRLVFDYLRKQTRPPDRAFS